MPEEGGLGAHLTLDMAGQAKFGPDVEWVGSLDYRVHPERAEGFYHTIRCYWPTLPDGALQPSYSGMYPVNGRMSDVPQSKALLCLHCLQRIHAELINLDSVCCSSAAAAAVAAAAHMDEAGVVS